MKIGITGDTHNVPGLTSIKSIGDMLEKMAESKPDVVIHVGDIGETRVNIQYVEDVLLLMRSILPDAQISAMAGNHDLWCNEKDDWDSMQLWTELLPQLAKSNSVLWLDNDTLIVDGVAIVGSYLHYDYSGKDVGAAASQHIMFSCGFTEDEYYAKYKYKVNNDGRFLIGLPPDKEFAATIGAKFRERLQAAQDNPAVTDIVIATHVPCMPSQLTSRPMDLGWSLSTPYFGNLSHVGFMKGLSKVRYVVSGHSHQGNEDTVEFDNGNSVLVINLDSDYRQPTFRNLEL